MENGYNQIFDLPTLLKLGDLDIRGVTANNGSLLAKEYFNTLSKFLDNTPTVIDSLIQIANLSGDENAFKSLGDIKNLLIGIGCDKLIPAIDGLLRAGEKGNKEFAAACAKRISADFSELYKRTMTACKRGKTSGVDTDTMTDKSTKGLTIKEALAQADYEEAGRKLRILAVDDNSFMLKTISSILSDDYEVFSLTKGTLVEKFLQNTTPELFLLDYNMPEMNGFELVSVIRSFEEHKDTPIIFLTAIGTVKNVTAAASLGACDYVVKPAKAEVLREKVAKHIVRKKAF